MSNGSGRLSNGHTAATVLVIRRLLWLLTTIGAIASFVIAIKSIGQPDPLISLAICSALAPYVAARAWDELFRGD